MAYFPYRFEGTIERIDYGRMAYTVVLLPLDLATELPFDGHPRLRIVGEIADVPFDGAWQPAGQGRHMLLVSKRLMAAAEVKPGDRVEVRFRIGDPERVEVPDDLTEALDADEVARAAWEALTPGTRRAFAHRVASAKAETTRARRVAEVLAMIRDGRRPGAPPGARQRSSSAKRSTKAR